MTSTASEKNETRTNSGAGTRAVRRPYSASSKFADQKTTITDPDAALQEQLQDDRYIDMLADTAGQYVSDLEISTRGAEGIYVPGKRIVSKAAAAEAGLAAFDDADDPFSGLPDDQPQPPSGVVDHSTVAAFTDGVTGQQKNDVEDSVLFASLAADLKFSVKDQPVEWFDYSRKVLARVGWILAAGQWSRLTSNKASFTVDEVVINVIKSMLTQNELATAEAALNAMKSLSDDDRRIVIWENSSLDGPSDGGVNIDVVGVSPAGALSMKASGYAFGCNKQITRFLFFAFPRTETRFAASRANMVLNERVYAQVREAISNKLGASAAAFVGTLPDFSGEIPT